MKNLKYLVVVLPWILLSCGNGDPVVEEQEPVEEYITRCGWFVLDSAPMKQSRFEDIHFVDSLTGWMTGTYGPDGGIFKTSDGGKTWSTYLNPGSYFRSIVFADKNKGWVGNLGPDFRPALNDTNILYQTLDGGDSWTPVTNIEGPKPKGICGLFAYDDSVIYASGRFAGPAIVLKSVNGGRSWTSVDLSHLALGLTDCYFWTPDSGIVIGISTNQKGVVIETSDGGKNWKVNHETPRDEFAWKISFPTRQVGYISLEHYRDTVHFLKTVDGGKTWKSMLFTNAQYQVQGIGFVSEDVGWIGGDRKNAHYTTDGGLTWTEADFGFRVNRFRFVDNVAYCVGNTIWKARCWDELVEPDTAIVVK